MQNHNHNNFTQLRNGDELTIIKLAIGSWEVFPSPVRQREGDENHAAVGHYRELILHYKQPTTETTGLETAIVQGLLLGANYDVDCVLWRGRPAAGRPPVTDFVLCLSLVPAGYEIQHVSSCTTGMKFKHGGRSQSLLRWDAEWDIWSKVTVNLDLSSKII